MRLTIRRIVVTLGVVASLIAGAMSIQLAAMWAAAAAPPRVPPVSMATLREQLAAEQARSLALQAELDQLTTLTSDLAGALDATGAQISTDGLTAKELKARLKAAQSKLGALTTLLKQAQARLELMRKEIANAQPAETKKPKDWEDKTPKPSPTPKPSRTPEP